MTTTTSNFKGLAGYGLCECGCGQKTNRAAQTKRSKGWIKGCPVRFVSGHNALDGRPEYLVDDTTGCWIWQRYLDSKGYGGVRIRGVRYKAHRVVYERHRGPIPEGLSLDHLCRNPACVNPDHLEAVTHAENLRRSPATKLTAEQARAIRESTGRLVDVAARFGVASSTVSLIRRGKLWAK